MENFDWCEKNFFRRESVHVFEPRNKEEIQVIRHFVHNNGIACYEEPLWLGFVMPRMCDGTGRLKRWVSEWPVHRELTEMNLSIFNENYPSDHKWVDHCTMSVWYDHVYEVSCYNETHPGYAVCEVDIEP